MTLDTQALLRQARAGDESALGPLLQSYGQYLTILARVQIGRRIQGKVDAGDIVQETFLEAHRQFPNFRGTSEPELVAWLRRILAGQFALVLRRYLGTKARDVKLELDLAAEIDQSSMALDGGLVASYSTPSQHASRREQAVLLAESLDRLSEDYREVIILRHLEALSFPDVARRMNRSEDSVQKLWVRALASLRRSLEGGVMTNANGRSDFGDDSGAGTGASAGMTAASATRAASDGSDASRPQGAASSDSSNATSNGNNSNSGGAGGDDDPRLLAAVREYMAVLETGRRPNRHDFLARHPDIADDLAACLDGLAFVHSAAGEMVGPGVGSPAGVLGAGSDAMSADAGVDDDDVANSRPLGDFRLIREIGRGGMGVVYEALQLSLGRRVAVKVLPFAATLDARHLQRFRNEAQAAAQLHHTNIVPVYAVGCERSVHYYAMQLIDGQSLADVIRSLRAAAGRTRDGQPPATDHERGTDANPPATTTNGHDAASDASEKEAGSRPARRRIAADDESDLTVSWHARAGGGARSADPADAAQTGGAKSSRTGTEPAALRLRRSAAASAGTSTAPADDLSLMRERKRRPTFYRTVARLGLQAAEALDYAHEQGVVHRDIKPENLLLDTKGNLWVTDFGLAQFYAESADAGGLTQTGDLLGTLRYMSPEQASGRAVVLDQRTDVYSLGLTLYELLTLERAMPAQTREQLLRQIDLHEPRSPRSIDRHIPPEMETIISKAAAKEPSDRYPTARALAEDLRRFLNDEPIHARPPSIWDKSVKWTRRHKPLAMSALAMLVLIAVGLLISTLLIAREQRKTKGAYEGERRKATEADQQRALVERSSQKARQVVDFLARIAVDEMGRPELAIDARKEMLEASLAYYQGFLDDRAEDDQGAAELREARSRVAALLTELAALDEQFRQRLRIMLLGEASVRQALNLSSDKATAAETFADMNRMRWPGGGGWGPGPGGGGPGQGGGGPGGRGGGGGPGTAFGSPGGPGGPGGGGAGSDLRQMTPDKKREWVQREISAKEAELNKVLDFDQAERLRQIARQVFGPLAFSDPDVVAALALTRQDKEKIRTVQLESRDRRRPGQNDRERNAASVREILAQLDAAQVATWQSLIGEPFTGTISFLDKPFGFDRPPGERNPSDRNPNDRPPNDRGTGPQPRRQ